MKTLLALLVLVSTADAFVLCTRADRPSVVKSRPEACRWYETPITGDLQAAVPIQGPPGPQGLPGPQGEPGAPGAPGEPGAPADFSTVQCYWYAVAVGQVGRDFCDLEWPGSFCADVIVGTPHWHIQCWSYAPQPGFAECCGFHF